MLVPCLNSVYGGMEATYLLWLDARPLLDLLGKGHRHSGDPAGFFLEEARVGLSDGRDFGQSGHVRLNFGACHASLG
jgi:cysteine-S-conjugate beta-lyase